MSLSKKKVLVTGAAGYIGSHIINFLIQNNYEVHSLDRNKISLNLKKKYLLDLEKDNKLVSKINYDCIVHLASYTQPRESFLDINKYIFGNLKMTNNLLQIFPNFKKLIFFSTANLYSPSKNISETSKIEVQSPYGESKLINERFLYHFSKGKKFKIGIFRLFNAAGGDIGGNFKYKIKKKNNLLIPSLIRALNKNTTFNLNGIKHKTPDGTCIRDFIHVYDIANAVNCFIKKRQSNIFNIYNLGSSKGYSVKQIVKNFEYYSKKSMKLKILENKKGDPANIVSNCNKIRSQLDWKPKYSDIETILKSSINGLEI